MNRGELPVTPRETPCFVYELSVLRARASALRSALGTQLLFGVKANPHPSVLSALRPLVDGLDIASEGELARALEAGWSGAQLSFAGPGKTRRALQLALAADVLISVESLRELELVRALSPNARVRLRVNPSTRALSFRLTMTGGPSPFGIDEEALDEAIDAVKSSTLRFEGLHVHPGAQCTSVKGFIKAVETALRLTARVEAAGLPCPSLNAGGGLGVLPTGESLDVVAVGRALEGVRRGYSGQLIFEPGRWLAAPMGTYVAKVISEKRSRGVHFVVLDGGINHFLSASGTWGPALPVVNLSRSEGPLVTCTIVGPLCTPLDRFGEAQTLVEPRVGDLLAIRNAGAYGPSMSPSAFLSHPLPTELIIE